MNLYTYQGSRLKKINTNDIYSENISSLMQIENELNTISNNKINAFDFNLRKNNLLEKNKSEGIQSVLSVKVKKKCISIVNFGLCINIGCNFISDYLHNKQIRSISLNFELKNISGEQNMIYYINSSNTKYPIGSFKTENSNFNNVNFKNKIDFIKNEIYSNKKLSFFLQIFKSYDDYGKFYDAISNVSLRIDYLG